MHHDHPPTRALGTSILLRRGTTARRVTLRLAVRARDDQESAARHALSAFLRAVDAEVFGPAAPGTPPIGGTAAHLDRAGDLAVYSLEAAFPRTRPEAFAVLARLVQRSVPHAVALTVREEGPESALVVRRFEPVETDATLADVPWQILLPICGTPAVTVDFAEDPDWHSVHQALERLEAWIDVVALGGFPGAGAEPFSRGALRSWGRFGPRTVGLRLAELACAHQGVEALYQALLAVHERTPIASVSVTSGPRADRRLVAPGSCSATSG
jgi:hypothetical protein